MRLSSIHESNDAVGDIRASMHGITSGMKENGDAKITEYAQRYLAGDESILQRLGPTWTRLVLQKVAELQAGSTGESSDLNISQDEISELLRQAREQRPVSTPAKPNSNISISGLERQVGAKPGTLAIGKSGDGTKLYVRNRTTGKYLPVPLSGQVEQAVIAAAQTVLR